MKNRLAPLLLAAIAVLLAANLMAGMAGPGDPILVNGVVTLRNQGDGDPSHRIYRFWSDGSVDTVRVGYDDAGGGCTIIDTCGQCVIGNCPADINLDGDVGPADLAQVLDHWGECPDCP